VEGWSDLPGCNGRDKEIRIVEMQQATLRSTDNEITKPIDIFIHDTHVTANANVTAHFEFTFNNGTKGSGTAEHHFTLIFVDDEWQVCNFTVGPPESPVMQLFPDN
jgi:hypothetical protein